MRAFRYYVSFMFKQGHGNAYINTTRKMNNRKTIVDVTKLIEENNKIEGVTIIYFKRIKREKVEE